ncbi:MAG: peptide chain release factor N(5)-glutamine methyltransferase [Ignavibacteria bacterium]|nr:peptide chain release factor N(5)-glutamine methyltransferase [Ignavibacteria bacterium]
MTVIETLKLAAQYLEKHEIENARLNAELLLADILNCKRLELYTNFDKPLKEEELQKYREFLLRRAKGEPLQYITGKANFYGIEFLVTPDVLIPRPETELLVEEILKKYDKSSHLKILDVCSGSGNIGITLAIKFPNSKVLCVDVSEKAISIAIENATRLNVRNISFMQLDILKETIQEKNFDVIVSNPPYISVNKKETTQREVRLYEPQIALFVDDELKFYKRIIDLSDDLLKENGSLFFEIDHELAQPISTIMDSKNFKQIKIKKDYADLNRIISGVKTK